MSAAQGVLVTLAIGLHNIPEGLAVATVLVARGVSPRQVRVHPLSLDTGNQTGDSNCLQIASH